MEILSSSKINYHPRPSDRSYSYEHFLEMWFYCTSLLENIYQNYMVYNVSLMWCWRRMENISWTGHVKNEVVLLRVKEQRNIQHEISKRKSNWFGHILCRNWLLRQVIEGKKNWGTEVTGRRGRKRRRLLDDLKERRWYTRLKKESLDRTMWRARFGRDFGPVVRQTAKWMNEWMNISLIKWTRSSELSLRTQMLDEVSSWIKNLTIRIIRNEYYLPSRSPTKKANSFILLGYSLCTRFSRNMRRT
jgi:hypothetical protein